MIWAAVRLSDDMVDGETTLRLVLSALASKLNLAIPANAAGHFPNRVAHLWGVECMFFLALLQSAGLHLLQRGFPLGLIKLDFVLFFPALTNLLEGRCKVEHP